MWGPKGGSGHVLSLTASERTHHFHLNQRNQLDLLCSDLPRFSRESLKSQETPVTGKLGELVTASQTCLASCQPTAGASVYLFCHFRLLHPVCNPLKSPDRGHHYRCASAHLGCLLDAQSMKETSHVAMLFPLCHLIGLSKNPWNKLGEIYIYSDITDDKILVKIGMTY